MDGETLKTLGAQVKEFSINYSRKVWREGDSLGGDWSVTCSLAPNADPDAAMNAAYEYIKEVARRNMAPAMTAIVTKSEVPQPHLAFGDTEPDLPQPPLLEETREPFIEDAETETFKVDRITVEYSKSGNKYAKVKGGKWTKYGVVAWKEVLALPPLEWDIEVLDAKDYGVPAGLEAVVLMEGETPKKVIDWA